MKQLHFNINLLILFQLIKLIFPKNLFKTKIENIDWNNVDSLEFRIKNCTDVITTKTDSKMFQVYDQNT